MILKNLKAIIFDLDDTLYLERDFVRSGFISVASHCHQENGSDEHSIFNSLWNKFLNGGRGNLFDLLLEENPSINIPIVDLINVYRSHKPDISLVKGVKNLLVELKKDRSIALISDGYLNTQKNKLFSLDISDLFDFIMFTDSLGKSYWKPSPVPYITVLNELNVKHEDSVYIADNVKKDFLYPNQSGMKTIRVKYEHGIYRDLTPETDGHAPTFTVNSILELKQLLFHGK